MHTIKVISGGLLLLAIMALIGKATGHLAGSLWLFVPIWLAAACFNMWMGVSRAGYPVVEELPMLALVFLVPAAVALLGWWYVTHHG